MKKNTPTVKKSETVVHRLRRPVKRMIHRTQRRLLRQRLKHGQDVLEEEGQ